VTETAVGFKWLVEEMLAGGVMIAGEESGGIGVPEHLPERDGIANGFLLLQALAEVHAGRDGPNGVAASPGPKGGPLAARLAAIERDVDWPHAYDRVDLTLGDDASKARVLAALDVTLDTFLGRRVDSMERRDGVKVNFADGAWILFRASGTEPLLRIYCEAHAADDVEDLLVAARRFAESAGGRSS